MNQDSICSDCRNPGTVSVCGVCEESVCKKCRQFLAEDSFPFAAKPAELKHTYYCGPCHRTHVEPFQETYETDLELAKQVTVFYKGSKSTFRLLKRADDLVRASGSNDRDETIMHLAFLAVRAGFNTIIEVEVTSEKVRNAGWQSSVWTGVGRPADVRIYGPEAE